MRHVIYIVTRPCCFLLSPNMAKLGQLCVSREQYMHSMTYSNEKTRNRTTNNDSREIRRPFFSFSFFFFFFEKRVVLD